MGLGFHGHHPTRCSEGMKRPTLSGLVQSQNLENVGMSCIPRFHVVIFIPHHEGHRCLMNNPTIHSRAAILGFTDSSIRHRKDWQVPDGSRNGTAKLIDSLPSPWLPLPCKQVESNITVKETVYIYIYQCLHIVLYNILLYYIISYHIILII